MYLLEFPEYLRDLIKREVLVAALTEIAVPAPEVTAVRDLKFKISKGWDRRGLRNVSLRARFL